MIRSAALGLALFVAAQAADYKDVNKTVSLNPTGSVLLETHKGSVHITTWDRPEVDIKARIEAEPGTQMDRRRFDATEVVIDSSSDGVRIRTVYPDFNSAWDNGNNPQVRYTIQMPRTASLTLHDHRSDSEISDLQGALNVDTHRGRVQVNRLSGPLHLTTHRGEVKVEFSAFARDSSIETHRGTIELFMPRASGFSLQANFGRRAVLDSELPIVTRASSRGGEIQGAVNGGGPVLHLQSMRGHIQLRTSR
jgi:hypothetical protein